MLRRTTLGLAVGAVAAGATKLFAAEGPRPSGGGAPVDNKPLAKNEAEKKILGVLSEMYERQRQGMMNVPPDDGRLLRILAETSGAKQVVEIGTSNGYSGTWTCLGLLGTGGKLVTHEIDAGRAAKARENFKNAGVDGVVTLVEGDAHKEIAKLQAPIDFVFLDADKEGYVDYLKQLLPKIRPGGLLLGHNVNSHARDLADYLKAVTTDPDLETLFANMQGSGLSLTLKKR